MPITVEMIQHNLSRPTTGIGRYTHELFNHLSQHPDAVAVSLTNNVSPPLANRFTPLHQFPLKVRDHQRGNIAHFMQIVGCSQMIWHPIRPSVATVHDMGILICEADELLFNRFEHWLLKLQLAGLKRMDYFVCVSQFTAESLSKVFKVKDSRISVIHHGIDHSTYHPIADARQQITERYTFQTTDYDHLLVYIGSELPRKNLKTLLQAIDLLKQKGYRPHLLKVGGSGGESWHHETLNEVHRLNLENDVTFTGVVPEADLPLFYNTADVFVTTSLLEGFGLPALEAMACGTPVVCSNSSALPEVVAGVGVLVDPQNAHDVAENLATVLDDAAQRQLMSERGIARAAQFTWEKCANEHIQFYEKIAS